MGLAILAGGALAGTVVAEGFELVVGWAGEVRLFVEREAGEVLALGGGHAAGLAVVGGEADSRMMAPTWSARFEASFGPERAGASA
jgi:hypothetical protein